METKHNLRNIFSDNSNKQWNKQNVLTVTKHLSKITLQQQQFNIQHHSTRWSSHTYEGLSLLPEAVFGCGSGLSAGGSGGVRVRGQWSTGSGDGLGDGQEELNVVVGQTDVQSRKLNLPKNHMHD